MLAIYCEFCKKMLKASMPISNNISPGEIYRDVPLSSLVLDPNNARGHSDENRAALRQSIEAVGQTGAILARISDKRVCAGNLTLEVLRGMGRDTGTVQFLDLSDEEFARHAIRDNAIGELGHWLEDTLGETLSELMIDGKGLDDLGLGDDILKLLDLFSEPAPEPNPKPEPETERKKVSVDGLKTIKEGQVWKLGNHRLACGNSSSPRLVERTLEGLATPSLLLTDPPYNLAQDTEIFAAGLRDGHKKLKEAEWDRAFSPEAMIPHLKALDKDAVAYIFTSHRLLSYLSALCETKKFATGFVVWRKTNPMPCGCVAKSCPI